MMQELANKLIAQARGAAATTSQPGNRTEGTQTSIRFGLWPFVSEQAPEAAMGLMVALAAQLDLWPDVVTYRLLLAADEETQLESGDLPIAESQFTVDDWQLEYLGENVAVWGELERSGAGWQLDVSVENDLTGADVETYTIRAETLGGLVAQLEALATRIATDAGAAYPTLFSTNYSGPFNAGDAAMQRFLGQAFRWERALFVTLWQGDAIEIDWEARLDDLLRAAAEVDASFGGAFLLALIPRALRLSTKDVVLESIASPWDVALDRLPRNAMVSIGAAWDHAAEDELPAGIALLNDALDYAGNDDSAVRLALANLYTSAGRLAEAIEVLQGALVDGDPHAALYFYYALLVVSMRNNGIVLNEYVLTDTPRRQATGMVDEALVAFESGFALMPDRADMLQQRLLLLVEVQHDSLWQAFEDLVATDKTGEYVRGVVESLLALDDLEPALDILADAVDVSPERVDLRVNYAVTLLQAEEYDAAGAELETAEDMTDDPVVIADIERLFLEVNDPDFESRWGEVESVLASARPLGNAERVFLQDVIEQAPTFTEAYLALAQSHIRSEAMDLALEVLLDGQNILPEDASITALLARVLWQSGEHDLAFDYLNKGLAHHPDDVSLLALSGRYLFDTEQDDEARLMLARAESLGPRDKTLVEVKRYIAGRL